jgi:hypothetical protein
MQGAAQANLDSFYLPGTSWTEYQYSSFGQGTGGYGGYKYVVMHDSVINSATYHILYTATIGHCTLPWWNNPPVTCSHGPNDNQYSLLGGVRVSNRQVFFLNMRAAAYNTYQPGQEKIAYDFDSGWAVGDTISWKTYNNVIQSIDSVQEANGTWLKRYNFQYYNNLFEDYWVEGVGSRLGFLGAYLDDIPTPQSYHALCYANTTTSYNMPDSVLPGNLDTNCLNVDQFVGVKEVTASNERMAIYPNPLSDETFHISDVDNIRGLEIMDATGRTVIQVGKIEGNAVTARLEAGYYMVCLQLKNGDRVLLPLLKMKN